MKLLSALVLLAGTVLSLSAEANPWDRDRGGWDRDRGGWDRDRGGWDRDRGGWGRDRDRDRGGWGQQPQVVSCSSGNYRFERCLVQGGRIEHVQLARQHSAAACNQGDSWGYDGNSVWVSKGCRADFYVYMGGHGRPGPGRPGPGRPGPGRPGPGPGPGPGHPGGHVQTIECSSSNYNYSACGVNGFIVDVQLQSQLSSAACIPGRSFGYNANQVWVNSGCRGIFRVVTR